jgi:hypothetical protein
MRLILDVDLPDALNAELLTAARLCRVSPAMWAASAIEAELASRRLPRVLTEQLERGGPLKGARVCVPETESALTEHRLLIPEQKG